MRDSAPLGAIAQLGERVLCKHEVVGSIPSGSTSGASNDEAREPTILVRQTACRRFRGVCRDFRHREEEVHPIV